MTAHRTGHDIHFLSRLNSRGDEAATERALRLYRDPQLVRRIVAGAPAGPRVESAVGASLGDRMRKAGIRVESSVDPDERVAIALGPGELPARVIVARNGHFVTCLAEGMRARTVYTVDWDKAEQHLRLDDASDRLSEMRRDQRLHRLYRSVDCGGFRMTREEFLAFRPIAPLGWAYWSKRALSAYATFYERACLVAFMRTVRSDDPACVELWRSYHAIGHWLMLSALGEQDAFEGWFRAGDAPVTPPGTPPGTPPEEGAEAAVETAGAALQSTQCYAEALLSPVLSLADGPLSARALWWLARGGKWLAGRLRKRLVGATSWSEWRAAALALLAIGARSPRLAETIRGWLQLPAPEQEGSAPIAACTTLIRDMAGWAMRRPEDLSEEETRGFRAWAGNWCGDRHDPTNIHRRFVDEEGLASLDFARRLQVNFEDHIRSTKTLGAFLRAFPLLMAMRPEDFFHPASDAQDIERSVDADLVYNLCEPFRYKREPARAATRPGRNDVCTCGSGRKFKRCCG